MNAPRVAVFGSFMMDLVGYAARRPEPGETLVGTGFAMRPGGKGFNQACAARRAGAQVAMIGLVGADPFGDRFLAELAGLGIDGTGVGRDQQTGTGVGLPLILPNGENSIVIVPRANDVVGAELADAADLAIEAADVLLLQLEVPVQASIRAAAIARASGTRVVLNPAPFAPVPDSLLRLADVVVPNEIEARQWLVAPPGTRPAQLAADLAALTQIEVVLTAGDDGAYVAHAGRDLMHVAARRVSVVDTVGAGDAFCGNVGASLAAGVDLVTAVRHAVDAASRYVAGERAASVNHLLESEGAETDGLGETSHGARTAVP